MKAILADDHPLSLMGTKQFVESLGHTVMATCSDGHTALYLIETLKPEVAILDINMPQSTGLEVLQEVFSRKLKTKIVLLTMHQEMNVFAKANLYGLAGYVLKDSAQTDLATCLTQVLENKQFISPKMSTEISIESKDNRLSKLSFAEKKVLELIAQHKTSKQIGELLFISEKTVEGHRSNIIQKLELPKEKNILLVWATKHF